MSLTQLFRRPAHQEAAERLYAAVVDQARRPEFYERQAVPDTLDGRFELVALHAFLVLNRLKQGEAPPELGQALFDAMFADFDRALRELGTGDLSVGREVKTMAKAFYGRVRAYEQGLAGGTELLADALARNLYGTVRPAPEHLQAMAAYLRTAVQRLGAQDRTALAATPDFGAPP